MTLGERLQKLRKEKGLSQDQMAEALNVSRQAVSKWERDEAIPEIDKIIKLSEIFSISIDSILKEEPQPVEEAPLPNPGYVREERPSDSISLLFAFLKRKWYLVGYAAVAWGLWDLVQSLIVRQALKSMTGSMNGFINNAEGFFPSGATPSDFMASGIESVSQYPLNALRLIVVLGVIKMVIGIFIVIFGKRHARRWASR